MQPETRTDRERHHASMAGDTSAHPAWPCVAQVGREQPHSRGLNLWLERCGEHAHFQVGQTLDICVLSMVLFVALWMDCAACMIVKVEPRARIKDDQTNRPRADAKCPHPIPQLPSSQVVAEHAWRSFCDVPGLSLVDQWSRCKTSFF
jgi:hypothetical protein